MDQKTDDVLKVALYLGIGFVTLKYVVPFFRGFKKVGDAAGDVLAKIIVGKGVQVAGSVLLPDVGTVKWTKIFANGTSLKSDAKGDNYTFSYLGKNYRLTGDVLESGTRVAELASAPPRMSFNLLNGAKVNALVTKAQFDSSGKYFLFRNRLYAANTNNRTAQLARQKTRVKIGGRTYVQGAYKVEIVVNS